MYVYMYVCVSLGQRNEPVTAGVGSSLVGHIGVVSTLLISLFCAMGWIRVFRVPDVRKKSVSNLSGNGTGVMKS